MANRIFSHCSHHNIDLHVQWIPRELNSQADYISKIKDCDDWHLTAECFDTLERPYLGFFVCGGKLRKPSQGSPVYRQGF